jgi:hypothetical protein
MEFIFDLLFEFFGELLLQILLEMLAEVGLQSLRTRAPGGTSALLTALGYIAMGAAAGGISLWLFPVLFIHSHTAQWVNVLITPLLAGLAMAAVGAWRRKKTMAIIGLDRFAYGYLFALTMALMRFGFAE